MKREPIKTTHAQIVEYWAAREDESNLAVDWADAENCCWLCGREKNVQRCHIIPAARGGADEPSNLVLLCERCHKEAVNIIDSESMWLFIKEHHRGVATALFEKRIQAEYEILYHSNWENDLTELILKLEKCDAVEMANQEIQEIVTSVYNETIVHYGEDGLNISTKAAARKKVLDTICEKYLTDNGDSQK